SGQATCLQEEIVRASVRGIGLALVDFVHHYGTEFNGFQRSSLEIDIGDDAFPSGRFPDICQCRLEDKITQVKKDRPATINLYAMEERRPVHHDDIRTCVYLSVRPFYQPVSVSWAFFIWTRSGVIACSADKPVARSGGACRRYTPYGGPETNPAAPAG